MGCCRFHLISVFQPLPARRRAFALTYGPGSKKVINFLPQHLFILGKYKHNDRCLKISRYKVCK
jgi:hypothetical protein